MEVLEAVQTTLSLLASSVVTIAVFTYTVALAVLGPVSRFIYMLLTPFLTLVFLLFSPVFYIGKVFVTGVSMVIVLIAKLKVRMPLLINACEELSADTCYSTFTSMYVSNTPWTLVRLL